MGDPVVSHGRGGAANIHKDSNQYVDGAIVRQGEVGDQGNGPYSAGLSRFVQPFMRDRGGRGNIAAAGVKTSTKLAGDKDVIPDQAVHIGNTTHYHIGRGGEGNRQASGKDDPIPGDEEGLAEKLKNKLLKTVGKPEEKNVEDD